METTIVSTVIPYYVKMKGNTHLTLLDDVYDFMFSQFVWKPFVNIISIF